MYISTHRIVVLHGTLKGIVLPNLADITLLFVR